MEIIPQDSASPTRSVTQTFCLLRANAGQDRHREAVGCSWAGLKPRSNPNLPPMGNSGMRWLINICVLSLSLSRSIPWPLPSLEALGQGGLAGS